MQRPYSHAAYWLSSSPRDHQRSGPAHINHQSRRCVTGLPTSLEGAFFSQLSSLLQNESSSCQIDIESSRHIHKHLAFAEPHLDICARPGETRPQAKRNSRWAPGSGFLCFKAPVAPQLPCCRDTGRKRTALQVG